VDENDDDNDELPVERGASRVPWAPKSLAGWPFSCLCVCVSVSGDLPAVCLCVLLGWKMANGGLATQAGLISSLHSWPLFDKRRRGSGGLGVANRAGTPIMPLQRQLCPPQARLSGAQLSRVGLELSGEGCC